MIDENGNRMLTLAERIAIAEMRRQRIRALVRLIEVAALVTIAGALLWNAAR